MNSDPAPESSTTNTQITIKVVNQYSQELFFQAKPSTKIKKLFIAYRERMDAMHTRLRFIFDGQRLAELSDDAEDLRTVQTLKIEDGDVIDVFEEQEGGSQLGTESVSLSWRRVSSAP